MKKNIIKKYKIEIIGLLIIFLFFYFVPTIFITILGKSVLFIIILFTFFYNVNYGIFLSILLFILYFSFVFYKNTKIKEAFYWTPESKQKLLITQSTKNRNVILDANLIEMNQASQEEVDYFNENGIWPWSESTKQLYLQQIKKNPYIKVAPGSALFETQQVYNEAAILMALSYQTKEGQFLINGVLVPSVNGSSLEQLPNGFGDFAYNSGLKQDLTKDVIRCNMDNETLERIHYTGQEGIYGSQTKVVSAVDFNNLESVIPGFQFMNGPCNPCDGVTEKPNYSCPFNLKINKNNWFDSNISNIWKNLWGIN
jgi:hypothetical protein